jgi:pimeloyl-ACP methyl ester carboxylesterase
MNLHWTRQGHGAPLLLLHGFTGVADDWQIIFDGEDTGFELLIPDLPGHGRSAPLTPFSFRQAAKLILADLDAMGVSKTAAIGMSGGAQVLLHLATQWPDRVGRTVQVSTAPYFPDDARKLMALSGPENQTPETWEMMRRKHPGGDDQIRTLFEISRGFADSFDDVCFTPPLLGQIAEPALIVHGDRDPLYPISMAIALHDAIADANLWILPGEGHCPIFDAERTAFRYRALRFLNSE